MSIISTMESCDASVGGQLPQRTFFNGSYLTVESVDGGLLARFHAFL